MVKTSTLKKRAIVTKTAKRNAVPVGTKAIKTKIDRAAWLKLHEQASKYPLSMRIAAELWKAGVTFEVFENTWHLEESGISKAVHAAMLNFKLGKGIDPDFVPPARPTYYEVSKIVTAGERATGRPSTAQALKEVREIYEAFKKRNWTASDIAKAFRVVIGDETEEGESSIPVRKVTKQKEFPVVKLSKTTKDEKSLELKIPEPEVDFSKIDRTAATTLNPPKSKADLAVEFRNCSICSKPLGSLYSVEDTENAPLFYHSGCWTISKSAPENLVDGQKAFDAKTGKFVTWSAAKKSWLSEVKQEQTPISQSVPSSNEETKKTVEETPPQESKGTSGLSKPVRQRIPGVGIIETGHKAATTIPTPPR